MVDTKVKISSIIENQLPGFVREEFPLVKEFLSQYYTSLESKSGTLDIIQNIDQYIKLDQLTNITESTILTSDVNFSDSTISAYSTSGFPESYGLLQIGSEVITYTGKEQNLISRSCQISIGSTIAYVSGIGEEYQNRPFNIDNVKIVPTIVSVYPTFVILSETPIKSNDPLDGYSEDDTYKFTIDNPQFTGCIRGFSGVTSYQNPNKPDCLLFSKTTSEEHLSGSLVSNLSILFLKEFYKKVKKQFVPGFEDRSFYSDLNENLFIKQSKDFYSSKGTDQSFEILFRSLYGEDVEVIKPSDYLFIPSNAQYRITKDLVVKSLEGNPLDLNNRTLYQDEDNNFPKAYASINNVEKIIRNSEVYHVISLDYDYNKDINVEGSVFGNFSIHPQTKLITPVSIGETVIDVDSTVGFPNSGTIIADIDNGSSVTINYSSKSYTQFYGCSGIDQELESGQNLRIDSYAYGYSGFGTENKIKVRVTGVLSDLEIDPNTKFYKENGKIEIQTLGKYFDEVKANNWIFNVATSYNIDTITLIDNLNYSYRVSTIDDNNFVTGNKVKLFFTDGVEIISYISEILNKNTFVINGQGELNISKKNKIQKLIEKANLLNFPESSKYSTDVQNIYQDKDGVFYVTSSSLPSYLNQQLTVKNNISTISGTFTPDNYSNLDEGTTIDIGEHGFYTGDVVYYTPQSETNTLGIDEGIYYVKRINNYSIKLSRSKNNLYNQKYLSFSTTVSDNKIVLNDLSNQLLNTQKLVRNISLPKNSENSQITSPGPTGILVNGVEILNYKSKDNIFYGKLEKINVLSFGSNYDVINPPILSISDSVGFGATGYCEVEGQFEEIRLIDGGFDYITEPVVTITGGNGFGAKAKAQLFEFEHHVSFSASGQVDLPTSKIGFSTYHKFRDGEKIIYKPDGQQVIGGLSTDSVYYTSVQDSLNIKLHQNYNDAISGINTINLTSYGVGSQRILSFNLKKKISSIIIQDNGSGYRNRKISVTSAGINTFSNTIIAKNHRYKTGDIINYSTTGTVASGLSTEKSYYVTFVDEDSFKLSTVGSSTTIGIGSAVVGISTLSDFYLKTKQYINLTSTGTGYHIFNHLPIKVTVDGVIGISTGTNQNFNAILQPIVRGEIKSIYLEDNGVGYGSSEIINFNRQPSINLQSGEGAEVLPVISNGKIVEVLVIKSGSGYNSPPSFIISGPGSNAVLTPVISNGSLTQVKVIYGGIGYETKKTSIKVISAGSGAQFKCDISKWTINLVERNINSNQITDDDGFINKGVNSDYGLQYTHLYAPRKLRQIVLSKKTINGQDKYSPDLIIDSNKETLSNGHSPIIGWAYDGNPIYGPYGYESTNGGKIKLLETGYSRILKKNRPPISIFPLGFFVEDYEYQGSGDLDEHNGRFCITPDFPNGIYAYFASIDSTVNNDINSKFYNFRKPIFPYFIGDKFKSKLNDYNILPSSNQDVIDLNETTFLRNTTPYNLTNKNSGYDFILNPNKIKKQNSLIKKVKSGNVNYIGIKTGGFDYQVRDRVVFDNKNSGGQGVSAEVGLVKGKKVTEVSCESISIDNVEFFPSSSGNSYIGFASSPHNLQNLDTITIVGLNTFASNLGGIHNNIGVKSETFILLTNIGTPAATGIVTYFNIVGRLTYDAIRENDILQIDSEKVKVLNVDSQSSRIRVIREQGDTVGSSHTASSIIYSNPRKFYFESKVSSDQLQYNLNNQFYFDPQESVGIGTSFGVGIGVTLVFSNPGSGITSFFIPTKSIYLPNHNLLTGDELIYSSNGGTPITVSTGSSIFQLIDNQTVYASKINDNLIGISTYKVGLGSTGSFVGIDSSITTNTLYFTNAGYGKIHSFTTKYSNVITGQVNKNLVTVSTASSHGINVGDSVLMSCLSGISTTYTIKYSDYHRRLVVNSKYFSSGDVDTSNDTINIQQHGFTTGQKIIHTATTASGGLKDNEIYFIVKIDNDKFKLSETYYNALLNKPVCIDITSSSSGSISLINPGITLFANQSIVFDLSDKSLSYNRNSTDYSAFDFNFYIDSSFKEIFNSKIDTNTFHVTRVGRVGVDTNASVTIRLSDSTPRILYYKLDPVDYDKNDQVKLEIISDSENISNNNLIMIKNSFYSGNYRVSGISTYTFSYNLASKPEKILYNSSESTLSYKTNSLTAFGEIADINVNYPGNEYKNLPGITTITSLSGYGAVLEPFSSSIGSILSTEIQDIGFEYSADKTLRPTAKISQILKLSSLYSFSKIGISSLGKNYNVPPNLIAFDGITNNVVNDVDLRYKLGDREVTIIKNTQGINNAIPRIIPTNNSNGIRISSIEFNNSTKEVTVGLAVSYSSISEYPFSEGDKVLIENTSVGIQTDSKGYNSSAYGYALFTLTSVNPAIGGANGTVTYSLEDYLQSGENPGTFSPVYSSGRITPQKFFPIFDITLKRNEFFNNEVIFTSNSSGVVDSWDSSSQILTVTSSEFFKSNDIIVGSSSNHKAIVEYALGYDASYNVSNSSIVRKGWKNESGFLNNNFQRLHDSDYYQYFSYDIKSKIEYEDWKDVVTSLNHTAGFKKFSNLIIESNITSGISTEQDFGDATSIVDYTNEIKLDCYNDYDLASEKTILIDSNIISDEVILKSVTLQDYFESVGNKVLTIDDISSQFNDNPRTTPYSVLDSFNLSSARSKKYIAYIVDRKYTNERQILIATLIHNDIFGFLNQYGRVETVKDLGSFDFNTYFSEGELLFYPIKYETNDYLINIFSYDMMENVSGIGTIDLGDSVKISSSSTLIQSGLGTTTLVGIASTYRASKILIQYAAEDKSYFEYDELTVLHDGSNVELLEYGQLSTDVLDSVGTIGIGTYNAYISGSQINIDFTPNNELEVNYYVDTIQVSIANTSSIGISTFSLTAANLESKITLISSSSSPVSNVICEYSNEYSGAYYIISIEDTTNDQYQVLELAVADDGETPFLSIFGILQTGSNIGDFDVTISGGKTQLTFTPIPDVDVQVRVFQNSLKLLNTIYF